MAAILMVDDEKPILDLVKSGLDIQPIATVWGIGLIGSIAIPFSLIFAGTSTGFITYAYYSESSAKKLVPVIAAMPDLTDVQLPMECKYLVLDKNYQVAETSLEGDDLDQAMDYAVSGKINTNLSKQYLLVTHKSKYVVLQYYIGSQFTNQWFYEHFSSPEILLYILIGINCIAVCVILTAKFAKNLQEQLSPLFEATKQVAGYQLHLEECDIADYMKRIEAQANSLCLVKRICLHMETGTNLGIFKVDELLLERAIMNVIDNALDYSPPEGTVYVSVQKSDSFLQISIRGKGNGFTPEALYHAQEQFFMDNHSRTSNLHFGMGLYITNSIIKQHNGQLILKNSDETNGVQVIIEIPY